MPAGVAVGFSFMCCVHLGSSLFATQLRFGTLRSRLHAESAPSKRPANARIARGPCPSLERAAPLIPDALRALLTSQNVTTLLPVQEAAYELIRSGSDAVIHAPTGSGKTLSYVLPLAARLISQSPNAASVPRGRLRTAPGVAIAPRIVVLAPSRELARQVGKVWSTYRKDRVATVFGGAPLERHAHLLRAGGGAEVVVATAGRLRELIREGHLSFEKIETLVLDEADMLLNFNDQPEVQAFLEGMDHDYQLVLSRLIVYSSSSFEVSF